MQVFLTGGALAGNISITNPFKNAAGNTITFSPLAALISVSGAKSSVTVLGK